jgi:hypothetical protein
MRFVSRRQLVAVLINLVLSGLGAFLIMNEHMMTVAAHRKIQPVL